MSTLMSLSFRCVRTMGIATCLTLVGLSASATTLDLVGSSPDALDTAVQQAVTTSRDDASAGLNPATLDRSLTDVPVLLVSQVQRSGHDSALTRQDDFGLDADIGIQSLNGTPSAHKLYAEFGRVLPLTDVRPQTLVVWLPSRSRR